MADKAESVARSLFSRGQKAEPQSVVDQDELEEDLGPRAAIAKNKWVTAITIRNAKGPWVPFVYSDIGGRAEFEPTRFAVEFVGHDGRYRLIVTGRNLGRIYNLVLQARLEWVRVADRPGFEPDEDSVIEGTEVVKVGEKR